jgi:hypothetical protein
VKKKNNRQSIVPINWVDESDRWLVVPGTVLDKSRKRIKEVSFEKSACLFATGVPKSIIDFIYRSVKKLGIPDTGDRLIFSRGMVRSGRDKKKYAVSVKELDWGVGTLIVIPRLLKYREHITLDIDGEVHTLRYMELVVLRALLQISLPGKASDYDPAMAAVIIARGWKSLELDEVPRVCRVQA